MTARLRGQKTGQSHSAKLRLLYRWQAGLFTIILFFTPHSLTANDEQKTRSQLDNVNKEIKTLNQTLKRFQKQRSSLNKELRKSELNIAAINEEITKVKRSLSANKKKLDQLNKQQNKLEKDKSIQEGLIVKQIQAAYQTGKESKLKLLLNQEKPETVARALAYHDYFNEARTKQLDQYLATLTSIEELKPQVLATTKALEANQQELTAQHRQLTSAHQQRAQSLAKLNESIRSNADRLKKRVQDRKELEKLLTVIEEAVVSIEIPSDVVPFSSRRGKMKWPVKGRIKNHFGSHRDGQMRWQGVNIPTKEGASVKAIHHGRVVYSDWLRGSGLLMIIDHGDGYMSLYAQNQTLLKETGEWVQTNETIATAGNSGGQSSAALYFEIRHKGKPTNPKQWCSG